MNYYTGAFWGYRYLYGDKGLTTDPKNAENAVLLYQMYVHTYPKMHGSYYFLGLAYLAQKDTIKAIGQFRRSLELHPFNPYAKKQLEKLEKL